MAPDCLQIGGALVADVRRVFHTLIWSPMMQDDDGVLAHNKLSNLRRRVVRARRVTPWTDPCSRHLHIMADCLSVGNRQYPMLQEEPEHCAETMYFVLEMLWKTRAELARLKMVGRN
jgi:hypothetical protein